MNDLRHEPRPAETVGWLGNVGDAMSRKFVLLSPGTRVEDALIWSEGRGAAWGVVVEDGRVVGGVAVSDLAACWDVSARRRRRGGVLRRASGVVSCTSQM